MRLSFAFVVAAAFMSGQMARGAEMRHFQVAHWSAGAYTNDSTGAFSHCAASAVYRSDIGLMFSINRDFHWSMGLFGADWRLPVGTRYPVAYSVDQLPPTRATALAILPNTILVALADSSTLFQQFQKGYVLHIATPKRVFSFNLTSTSKLLPVLLECARNRGKREVATSNPFEANTLKPSAKS